jgi:hypothetical protein
MTGDSATFIAVVACVVAAAAAVPVALPWLAGRINTGLFADMVVKLVDAGNLDRARKLCAAAPRSLFVTACARCLDALPGASASDAEATAELRETFVGAVRDGVRRRQRTGWLSLVSLVAVAIAVYMVVAEHAYPGALAGVAVAGALLAFTRRATRRLARDTVSHGERVYSALVASRGRS